VVVWSGTGLPNYSRKVVCSWSSGNKMFVRSSSFSKDKVGCKLLVAIIISGPSILHALLTQKLGDFVRASPREIVYEAVN
jgi:hypothetical protein